MCVGKEVQPIMQSGFSILNSKYDIPHTTFVCYMFIISNNMLDVERNLKNIGINR